MRFVLLALVSACYPGVDNSDCAIRCGEKGACPSNLSCVGGFCVEDGQTCVDPGLVLAYSFDSIDNGQVVDQSGAGNNGGVEGGLTLIGGVHGSAMLFEGDSGEFLVARHSPSLAVAPGGAFTVSFWINLTSEGLTEDQVIVGKVADNDQAISPFYEFGIEFRQNTRLIELFIGDDTQFITAYTIDAPFDRFVHLAFTWDGQRVEGYLDGALQPFADRDLELDVPDRGKNLVIGAQSNGNERLTGALDDLRIYNRALSAAEIDADRNSAVAP